MRLSKLLHNAQIGDFIRHRYFMIGLGLQKGMPLLIIPMSIQIIGAGVYAQYVLIYTLVQVLGVLGSLSLAQAIFPFWYENESKESLVGSLLLVMAAVEAALFAIIGLGLYFVWPYTHLDITRTQALILILPYAAAYNLNALVLNILRLRLRQLAFFLSTAVTSAALLAFIFSLRFVHGPKLLWFTAVNIVVLLIQTALYMINADAWPRRLFPSRQFMSFARAVLRYSWPLTLYTLITLATSTVDKWIVRGVFPAVVFARYVLDIQFSFALSFVSIVIGMYNNQKLCELVHLRDRAGLRSNLLGNYSLNIAGSIGIAVAIYCYARLGGIHLTYGFWMLAVAFTLGNCYNVNSGLLSAQKRSRRLALIGVGSMLIFAGILSVLFVWRSPAVVYVAYLTYYGALLAFSWKSVWSGLRGSPLSPLPFRESTVANTFG
jgi:O-antigen/teichoic acid export membrane protein